MKRKAWKEYIWIILMLVDTHFTQLGSFRPIKYEYDQRRTNEVEKVNIGINGFS